MAAAVDALRLAALQRLQQAGYARLGIAPPDFSAEAEARKGAGNAEALKPGGEIEQAMTASFVARGLDPAAAQPMLKDLRKALEQIVTRQRALPPSNGQPPSLSDLHHRAILLAQQQRLERLVDYLPEFAAAFAPLLGKVTLDDLPTGELNARTLFAQPASNPPSYWILFDPVFFDFYFHLSNAFASAIDLEALGSIGARYARGDDSASYRGAIRQGDPKPVYALFELLRNFTVMGIPPVLLTPYDERGFQFADAIRDQAALFVVAHEYGHILRGDLSHALTTDAWRAETGADLIGWRLANAVLDMERVPPASRLGGVNLFFAGLLLLELARRALADGQPRSPSDLIPHGPPDPKSSHPPASVRLGLLMEEFRNHFPQDQNRAAEFFASLMLELVGLFWERLEPAFLDMHGKGLRPIPVWKGMQALEQGLVH